MIATRPPSLALVIAMLATACGEHTAPVVPNGNELVSSTPSAAPPPQPASGEPPTALVSPWLTFLQNGNLLLIDRSEAMLYDGKVWHRHTAPPETQIELASAWGSEHVGLVVGSTGGYRSRYDRLKLLSSGDLHVLYEGMGRLVDGAIAVAAPQASSAMLGDPADDIAVVFEYGGKAVSLPLPASGGPKALVDLQVGAGADLAVVTWEDGAATEAAAYTASTAQRLGAAVPAGDSIAPTVAAAGHLQYYIAKSAARARPSVGSSSSMTSSIPPAAPLQSATAVVPVPALGYDDGSDRSQRSLVVRNLVTGQVLRQRPIACKGFLGNPTVSPNGDTVLVTCEMRGIVLDGRTLLERRRVGSIIPGCDNGMDLSGRIESDAPPVLKIEGCGGYSKLNLATGAWICADEEGLMGAPYEMVPQGDGTSRRPPQKPKAPACSPVVDNASGHPLGTTGIYSYIEEERILLGARGLRIQLEPEAGFPVMSPSDDRIAYVLDKRVVVRLLPSGTVLDTR